MKRFLVVAFAVSALNSFAEPKGGQHVDPQSQQPTVESQVNIPVGPSQTQKREAKKPAAKTLSEIINSCLPDRTKNTQKSSI